MTSANVGTRAFIGLGSNLSDPIRQLSDAIRAIRRLPQTSLAATSSFYQSSPLGPPGQPDYINAVVELRTELMPDELLDVLQEIERAQGRARGARWGARTLDLDILLYGDLVLNTPRLTIPHPEMTARNFVLFPLAELQPDLILPGGEALTALLANVPATGIVLLSGGE